MSGLPGENVKMDRLLNAMDTHFAQILEIVAEMSIVSSRNRSVFVVYAHDNPNHGESNAELVKKLIQWLNDANVTVLSDRSPWDDNTPSWVKTRGIHDKNPGRDILWNQMRLLPKCRYPKGADKVFLCCSEVLKGYDNKRNTNPDIARYYQEIQEGYVRAQDQYMQEKDMYNEIHEVIQRSSGDDFHHVLTELALLTMRKENKDTKEDESQSIIPVVLNGDLGQYKALPFLDNPTTICTKFKAGRSLLESNQYEHDLFFKLLESLHSYDDYQLIKDLSNAYSKYAMHLINVSNESNNGGETCTLERLKDQSELEIRRVRQKIEKTREKEIESRKAQLKSLKVLPFQRNPIFTGRYREFGHLFKIFFENVEYDCPHAALFGLGGIGKTQIAVEFAYRIQEQFPGVSIFWVQANDATSFEASYRKIAEQLGIPLDIDNLDIRARANEKLSQYDSGKWLMVVDSADCPILNNDKGNTTPLAQLLPSSSFGGILFTTRNLSAATDYYAKSNAITVDQMNEREATALLRKGFRDERLVLLEDEGATSKLLKHLCMLPLAIMQTVYYLNKVPINIETYLKMFNKHAKDAMKLLSRGIPDQDMDLPTKKAVATTWIISFEQIEKTDQLAAKYLKCIAIIRDKDIPGDLLPDSEYDQPTIEQMDALSTLVGFGFLKPQRGERLYNMHRLVHLVSRNWLENKGELSNWTALMATRLLCIVPMSDHEKTDYEKRQKWAAYLPHGMEVSKTLYMLETMKVENIELSYRIGRCQWNTGQYKNAESTFQTSLEFSIKELGNEHLYTLMGMNSVASVLYCQGKYIEAETIYRKAIVLMNKVLGDEHPDILTSMSNLALVLQDQGKYAEAKTIQCEVLVSSKKVLGDQHHDILANMDNLASVLRDQGKYVEAETIYRKALESMKNMLGDEHPHTLMSMSNLASVLQDQGKCIEAETIYRKALVLMNKVLGDEHPDTLISMSNLALVLRDQGKCIEAETIYRKALVLMNKVLGGEHPDTIINMNNLALVLRDQGKYVEAETIYRKVLVLMKKVLGDEHPQTLRSMNSFSLVLYYQGKYIEAETIYRKVLVLMKKVLGDEHPHTLMSMSILALILRDQGKYIEAETVQRKALVLMNKVLRDEHPNTLISMSNLASVLRDQGKYVEAETIQREALVVMKKVLGDEHPNTLTSMSNLASVLQEQGKCVEAETIYRKALVLMNKVLGDQHPYTLASMKNLALVLYYQGKYIEAETTHHKARMLMHRVRQTPRLTQDNEQSCLSTP